MPQCHRPHATCHIYYDIATQSQPPSMVIYVSYVGLFHDETFRQTIHAHVANASSTNAASSTHATNATTASLSPPALAAPAVHHQRQLYSQQPYRHYNHLQHHCHYHQHQPSHQHRHQPAPLTARISLAARPHCRRGTSSPTTPTPSPKLSTSSAAQTATSQLSPPDHRDRAMQGDRAGAVTSPLIRSGPHTTCPVNSALCPRIVCIHACMGTTKRFAPAMSVSSTAALSQVPHRCKEKRKRWCTCIEVAKDGWQPHHQISHPTSCAALSRATTDRPATTFQRRRLFRTPHHVSLALSSSLSIPILGPMHDCH